MNARFVIITAGVALFASCGSGTSEPGEEDSIPQPPPEEIPPVRLVAPPPPPSQPLVPQAQESIFRTPDPTTDLPEEKDLLSRPISAPAEEAPTLNN